MSLPTLDDGLAKIYEPGAPAPSQRLDTLRLAKQAGLNVYVAVAPTYPECGEEDLRRTLTAVRDLDPFTIFHEPINLRAENVARIEVYARSLGQTLRTEVFRTPGHWAHSALRPPDARSMQTWACNFFVAISGWIRRASGSQHKRV